MGDNETTTTVTDTTVTDTAVTDTTVTTTEVRENAKKADGAFTDFKYGGDPFNPGVPEGGAVTREATPVYEANDPRARIDALETRVSALEAADATGGES